MKFDDSKKLSAVSFQPSGKPKTIGARAHSPVRPVLCR